MHFGRFEVADSSFFRQSTCVRRFLLDASHSTVTADDVPAVARALVSQEQAASILLVAGSDVMQFRFSVFVCRQKMQAAKLLPYFFCIILCYCLDGLDVSLENTPERALREVLRVDFKSLNHDNDLFADNQFAPHPH